MEPEWNGMPPKRAIAVYVVAASALIFAVMVPLVWWLAGLGMPWWAGLAAVIVSLRLLLLVAGHLSVPVIPMMIRRWPTLARDRLGGDRRGAA
jgi:hypothetical protein